MNQSEKQNEQTARKLENTFGADVISINVVKIGLTCLKHVYLFLHEPISQVFFFRFSPVL